MEGDIFEIIGLQKGQIPSHFGNLKARLALQTDSPCLLRKLTPGYPFYQKPRHREGQLFGIYCTCLVYQRLLGLLVY